MRKLLMITSAILGLGCLYPTTISAQTCTAAPSCADMGYTKTVSDCSGKNTLKCPFDLTKVSCEEAITDMSLYSYPVVFKVHIKNPGPFRHSVCISETGSSCGSPFDVLIDCGNGKLLYYENDSMPYSEYPCVYDKAGDYIIRISGVFNMIYHYEDENYYIKELIKLNHPMLYYLGDMCSEETTGSIPELPPNLKSGRRAFQSCSGLTGSVPALPDTLTNGYEMFSGCSGLTGGVPSLPDGLIDADGMFYKCSKLKGKSPNKPSNLNTTFYSVFNGTQITNNGTW